MPENTAKRKTTAEMLEGIKASVANGAPTHCNTPALRELFQSPPPIPLGEVVNAANAWAERNDLLLTYDHREQEWYFNTF